MTIALDVGTHRLRSLRHESGRLVARSHRMHYAVLPDSESHRRLLADAHVQFAACDDGLLLLGDSAWDHAGLFHVASRQLLVGGRLPDSDPVARQLIATLVDAVLPQARTPHELCSLSFAGLEQSTPNLDFFSRVVRLRGYTPMLVSAGIGLILSELVRSSFSGVSFIFGASACEAVLAHRGVTICQTTIPRGGDWIDASLAERFGLMSWDPSGAKYLDTSTVCRARESSDPRQVAALAIDPEFPAAVQSAMEQLMTDLLTAFSEDILRNGRALELPQPMALICGGGLTESDRFLEILKQRLAQTRLPIATQAPILASGWPHNVARGLLIAAELEAPASNVRDSAPRTSELRAA